MYFFGRRGLAGPLWDHHRHVHCIGYLWSHRPSRSCEDLNKFSFFLSFFLSMLIYKKGKGNVKEERVAWAWWTGKGEHRRSNNKEEKKQATTTQHKEVEEVEAYILGSKEWRSKSKNLDFILLNFKKYTFYLLFLAHLHGLCTFGKISQFHNRPPNFSVLNYENFWILIVWRVSFEEWYHRTRKTKLVLDYIFQHVKYQQAYILVTLT